MLIELKIGRHKYNINKEDEFMDNGSVVQLLTQSNEKLVWGVRPDPTLSKSAIKEISKFKRVDIPGNYDSCGKVSIFRLNAGE